MCKAGEGESLGVSVLWETPPPPFTQLRVLKHLLWARPESRHLASKSKPGNKFPKSSGPDRGRHTINKQAQ